MPLDRASADAPCPCGSAQALALCCRPLLLGERLAGTPEQLMRSRYTAYALDDVGHVFRTWHPRTRPDDVAGDPRTRWTGLTVLAAEGDEVEFVATYETRADDGGMQPGRMHERSRFAQRAGRWLYLDGQML